LAQSEAAPLVDFPLGLLDDLRVLQVHQPNIERTLAEVAEQHGGQLIVEERHATLGPIPIFGEARNGHCPRCGGGEFWYLYGDIYGTCGRCGLKVEVPEDLV
jgi:hypothetical protein